MPKKIVRLWRGRDGQAQAHAACWDYDRTRRLKDGLVSNPATRTPAPQGFGSTGDPLFQTPWTTAGLPTITLPCGLSTSGLPLGVQLIAAPFAEPALLAAAAWCQELLGLAPAPPL